jgi:hypothetical protein
VPKAIFRIDGMPRDAEYNRLPFGRQIEYNAQINRFKASAKSVHFNAKGTSTATAFCEFRRLYRPGQWYLVNRDAPEYHDDSFQVWYTA